MNGDLDWRFLRKKMGSSKERNWALLFKKAKKEEARNGERY